MCRDTAELVAEASALGDHLANAGGQPVKLVNHDREEEIFLIAKVVV